MILKIRPKKYSDGSEPGRAKPEGFRPGHAPLESALLVGAFNPAAADHDVVNVENGSLPRSDRPLRFVKNHLHRIRPVRFNRCRSWLVLVPDLHRDLHRLAQLCRRNQGHLACAKGTRIKLLILADHDLPRVVLDLNHVKRRTGSDAKPLTLPDRKVMNAAMLADHLTVGGDHLAANLDARAILSLLGEISFEKALVVPARDEANFLRVGLLRNHQLVLASEFPHFGLGHPAQRKQRAAQLFLCKPKQKISLIFRFVRRTLKQPSPALLIKGNPSIMSGRNRIGANLPRHNQKLIKLQVIVTEAARDRRAPRQILLNKRTHHIALKTLLVIDHVVRNAERLRDTAGIVNIVDRTAAPLHRFRHARVPSEPPLVPKLHGETDNIVAVRPQHSRNGRGVNSSRHSNGDGSSVSQAYDPITYITKKKLPRDSGIASGHSLERLTAEKPANTMPTPSITSHDIGGTTFIRLATAGMRLKIRPSQKENEQMKLAYAKRLDRDSSSMANPDRALKTNCTLCPHRRQLAQPSHCFRNNFERELHILFRILLPQTKPNTRLRALPAQPHRSQHVRRLKRSRGTCRASRNRQSLQVQRNHQRLAFDAIETNVGRVRNARSAFAIQPASFNREQFPFQAIAHRRYLQIVTALEPHNRQLRRLPQPDDARNILRPRAPRTFMTSAIKHRLDLSSLANEKRAHALRRVKLVPGNRQQIASDFANINRNFPRRLHRIGVKINVSFRCNLPNLRYRLQHARLVVGEHDRNQLRIRTKRAPDIIRIDETKAIHRNECDFAPVRSKPLAGIQHSVMLNGRRNDMVTRPRQSKYRQIVRLGSAAGEYYL